MESLKIGLAYDCRVTKGTNGHIPFGIIPVDYLCLKDLISLLDGQRGLGLHILVVDFC